MKKQKKIPIIKNDLSQSVVLVPSKKLELQNIEVADYIDDFLQISPDAVFINDITKTAPKTKSKPAITAVYSFPVPLKNLANYSSLKKKQTDVEFQQAYNVALNIVTQFKSFNRQKQLMAIAEVLRYLFDSGRVHYTTSEPHYNDPYGYFILGVASCAGCTRATGLCLNILGIPYEHVHENKWDHQWCRVNVNGTYWICDAFGLYCGPEPAPYKHPKF